MTPGYVLLEDGTRLEGELCGAIDVAGAGCGEVVFNTGMTGYQESVTDPSYAGPDHHLHLPADRQLRRLRRGDGVRRGPRSRRDHARRAQRRGLRDAPRVAGSTGSATAAWRRSPASTPGPWSATSATAARCGAGSSRPSCRSRRRASGSPPSRRWTGADLARTVTPAEPVLLDGDGPAHRRHRHRDQALDRPPVPRARLPADAAALHDRRRAGARARARPRLPRQRPRRPGGLRLRRRHRPRADRQAADLRHLPRPPAALPGGRPADLQAAVRPPRRQPSGQGPGDRARSTSPPRITASRSAVPGASETIEGDEPVRWETDFGAAELSHLNLYDRTVEGLRAPRRRRRHGPVPPRGGARPARRPLPVRPLPGARRLAMPRRDDIHKILLIGSGPIVIGQAAEFDYSGVPGLQGAARGGLRGRAGQLEPGDDHDRPRVRRRHLRRAAAARRRRRRSSRRSGPTRCCRRSAARPRSTWPWRCTTTARWSASGSS